MKFIHSAVLAVTVAATVLAPTAAEAKTYRHADATGDVFSTTGDSGSFVPAPDRVNGDIVASTIKHRRSTVVLQLRYRDLVPDGEINAHYFLIRTSKMRREVTLVAGGGFPGSHVEMTKLNGTRVRCRITRRVDYSLNTATVVVPRGCLRYPRWVKVSMSGVILTGFGSTDTRYVDDALSASLRGRFSPRVYR